MIHARVDVELRDHEKAHRAGQAMGTWTWCLLWTRAKERDGFVAAEALRGAWAGEKQAVRDMATLVRCGLAVVVDGGWMLHGYADKNETREQIDARRAEGRERKRKHDAKRRSNAPVTHSADALVTRYSRVSNATEPEPEPEPDLPPNPPPGGGGRSQAFDGAFDGTADAFVRGVTSVTGGKHSGLDWRARGELSRAIQTHAGGLHPDDLAAWTERVAAEFAGSVSAAHGGLGPGRFRRWLDDGKPKAKPSSGAYERPVQRWDPSQARGEILFQNSDEKAS